MWSGLVGEIHRIPDRHRVGRADREIPDGHRASAGLEPGPFLEPWPEEPEADRLLALGGGDGECHQSPTCGPHDLDGRIRASATLGGDREADIGVTERKDVPERTDDLRTERGRRQRLTGRRRVGHRGAVTELDSDERTRESRELLWQEHLPAIEAEILGDEDPVRVTEEDGGLRHHLLERNRHFAQPHADRTG